MGINVWVVVAATAVTIVRLSWLLSLALASRRWPRVEGKVLSSYYEKVDADGPQFIPRIEYEYSVNGRRYQSHRMRYRLFERMFSDKDDAEGIAACYRPDDPVSVWYDPAKPSRATLERGGQFGYAVALVIVCLVGPAMAFATSS